MYSVNSPCFLLYRKFHFYTVKNNDYIAVQNFMKSKAFQKCTWLKKSDNAPHFRRRRCGGAAFLGSHNYFLQRKLMCGIMYAESLALQDFVATPR